MKIFIPDSNMIEKDFSKIQMIKTEVKNLYQEKKYLSLESTLNLINDIEKIISMNQI